MQSVKTRKHTYLEQKVDTLKSAFETIYHERMKEIPVINKKLSVRCIGFQPWQKFYVGILVTPWFMNIILLPGESENWDDKIELSSSSFSFPSGNYEFLVGYEPLVGKYQLCSLFSPMFEFADDQAAIDTATAAIVELMNEENQEKVEIDNQNIEKIWRGEPIEEEAKKKKNVYKKTVEEKIKEPISRRELLRGALFLEDDHDKPRG